MIGINADVYATLGIQGDIDPVAVTRQLGTAATRSFLKGDAVGTGRGGRTHDRSGWFLETDRTLGDSIDPHLDWILQIVEPVAAELDALRAGGATTRLDCFWSSVGMSGGPWLTADKMKRLGRLELDLVVSFYASE